MPSGLIEVSEVWTSKLCTSAALVWPSQKLDMARVSTIHLLVACVRSLFEGCKAFAEVSASRQASDSIVFRVPLTFWSAVRTLACLTGFKRKHNRLLSILLHVHLR